MTASAGGPAGASIMIVRGMRRPWMGLSNPAPNHSDYGSLIIHRSALPFPANQSCGGSVTTRQRSTNSEPEAQAREPEGPPIEPSGRASPAAHCGLQISVSNCRDPRKPRGSWPDINERQGGTAEWASPALAGASGSCASGSIGCASGSIDAETTALGTSAWISSLSSIAATYKPARTKVPARLSRCSE